MLLQDWIPKLFYCVNNLKLKSIAQLCELLEFYIGCGNEHIEH